MVRNPQNVPSYAAVYDIDGLRELAEKAKAYVRSEETTGSIAPGSVPDGTYSDLDCSVWSLFVECCRFSAATP